MTRIGNFEMSDNPHEGIELVSVELLESLPTIYSGHWSNLKRDTGSVRYHVSRCGPEDGEEWQVYVERLDNGSWVDVFQYREVVRCVK